MILAETGARLELAAHDALGKYPTDSAGDCVFRLLAHDHSLEGRPRLVESRPLDFHLPCSSID
jgi:hypothetical protein